MGHLDGHCQDFRNLAKQASPPPRPTPDSPTPGSGALGAGNYAGCGRRGCQTRPACLWFTALWQGRARLRRLLIGFGPDQPLKSIQLFHNYGCHIAVRVATDEQIHVRIIRDDPLIV